VRDVTEDSESLPIAVVAVIMRDRETLVIRRDPGPSHPGYFGPVMVHLAPGESEHSALVTGVHKEVGLQVRPIRKVWECVSQRADHNLHWWLAEYVSGAIVRDGGATDAAWVSPSELSTLDKAFANDRKFYLEVLPNLPETAADAV
jgi:8-oxo-dGTP diphosphatase